MKSATDPQLRLWTKEGKMVVPPDNQLKRDLIHLVHNKPTGGHVGRDWTLYMLSNIAWWPTMKAWVEEYIKGCAPCQQNKNVNRRMPTPLYKITVSLHAWPFKVVSMDLITQLPKSHGYNAILTIVDHRCTRAALFVPRTTNVTGEGIT